MLGPFRPSSKAAAWRGRRNLERPEKWLVARREPDDPSTLRLYPRLKSCSPVHINWSRDRGDSERRSYYHGNLREALIRAALELIAAKGLGRDEDVARELRSSTGRVRRSRRAHGDNPLDLRRMPPVALGCGNPLIVESTGDVGCGSDALSAQSLNGCHGGYVTHQPYRLIWLVVVHGAFPAGLRTSVYPRERANSYFNPGS